MTKLVSPHYRFYKEPKEYNYPEAIPTLKCETCLRTFIDREALRRHKEFDCSKFLVPELLQEKE